MQITEIDPSKKYILALPEANKEFALKIKAHLNELQKGDKTFVIVFGTEVAIIPADQIVGYTTFEDDG